MKLVFPDYAKYCIEKLESNRFEAWFVGGCVRDAILERECQDIDITTNATPEQIVSIFQHTIPTGIKHGTVTVISDGKPIEITTYRTEDKYTDFRHPEKINFVEDITKDLSRRDFTINALAYNDKQGLKDLFGGLDDIKNKTIRSVGNPLNRFREDALRILRAYRFAGVLGFSMSDDVKNASIRLIPLLEKISGERVLSELTKLSSGKNISVICDFINHGGLSGFGINNLNCDVDNLQKISESNVESIFKLPLLISLTDHDTKIIKRKLKPDNRFYASINLLDRLCAERPSLDDKISLKKLLSQYGADNVKLYLNYLRVMGFNKHHTILENCNQILSQGEPYSISHLAIGGDDLVSIGISGRDIGRCLEYALDYVIKYPERNTKNLLITLFKK